MCRALVLSTGLNIFPDAVFTAKPRDRCAGLVLLQNADDLFV
jgi:hypothetical protein